MLCDLVILADMANVDAGGKLNIIGEFNTLIAKDVPTPPRNMTLVARIIAQSTEGAQHRVGIAIVNQDGGQLARLPDQEIQFGATLPGTSGDFRSQLVIGMQGVQFPAFGAYTFHVLVDGHHYGERTLYVVPREQAENSSTGE